LIIAGQPFVVEVVSDATQCGLGVYRPTLPMKYLQDNQVNRVSDLDEVIHVSLRHKVYYHPSKIKALLDFIW
jgi:hypothetical protein